MIKAFRAGILISLCVFSTSGANCQTTFNPTSPALGFNVFTRTSVTFSAGDTHGPVATGGNVTLDGATTVSMNYTGDYPTVGGSTTNYGLVIGGRINYIGGNTSTLNNGIIKIGSTTGSDLYNVNGSSGMAQIKLNEANSGFNHNPSIYGNNSQALGSATTGNSISFANAFSTMQSSSNRINNYNTSASNSSTFKFASVPLTASGGTQTINIDAGKVNFINLSAADLTTMGNSGATYVFSQSLSSSTIVIFNIPLTGTYNWSPPQFGSISDNSYGEGQYMLWNFPTAGTVNIVGSRSTIGTLFAPSAAIVKTAGNNTAGQVIADALTIAYGEIHHDPFMGNLPIFNTPLPIEYLQLSVKSADRLHWRMAVKGSIQRFTLERSLDGQSFAEYASQPLPAANTTGEADIAIANGAYIPTQYFRLKAVEYDHSITYSNTIKLSGKDGMPAAVNVYPNPFSDKICLSLRDDQTAEWSLTNATGAVVLKGSSAGPVVISSISQLPGGFYFLSVTANGESSVTRLTKSE